MEELTEDQCLEALYNGIRPSKIYAPNVAYNEMAAKMGLELIPDEPIFSGEWLMPNFYKTLDVVEYFSSKVSTDAELERAAQEIQLFIDADKIDLLRYAIYLGSVIKKHGIVTGVGRGSSVSIFTFYLAGIHKVNSLAYNLSPMEFFKIKQQEGE